MECDGRLLNLIKQANVIELRELTVSVKKSDELIDIKNFTEEHINIPAGSDVIIRNWKYYKSGDLIRRDYLYELKWVPENALWESNAVRQVMINDGTGCYVYDQTDEGAPEVIQLDEPCRFPMFTQSDNTNSGFFEQLKELMDLNIYVETNRIQKGDSTTVYIANMGGSDSFALTTRQYGDNCYLIKGNVYVDDILVGETMINNLTVDNGKVVPRLYKDFHYTESGSELSSLYIVIVDNYSFSIADDEVFELPGAPIDIIEREQERGQ